MLVVVLMGAAMKGAVKGAVKGEGLLKNPGLELITAGLFIEVVVGGGGGGIIEGMVEKVASVDL